MFEKVGFPGLCLLTFGKCTSQATLFSLSKFEIGSPPCSPSQKLLLSS